MEHENSNYVDLARELLAFTDKNIWPIILLIIIILTRKSLTRVVDRLIKLNFSFGGATGAVEAAHPLITSEKAPLLQADTEEPTERLAEQKPPEENDDKHWMSKAIDAFSKKDTAAAKKSFNDAQREEDDPKVRFDNECLFLFLLFDYATDLSALEKLENLNQQSKNDEQIKTSALWLSSIYRNLNDHKKHKSALESAIERTTDENIKTTLIIRLSAIVNLVDGEDVSISLLEKRLTATIEDEQKSVIYEGISEIYKENGKGYEQAIALEKSVEYSPGNKKLLFDAAYSQSNENLNILSIQNYSTLLSLEPEHQTALNNLGVSAGQLKIKGKQTEFLKKAKNEGSTLAMSNLANIYIESGLYDEAATVLNETRNSENIHENVGTSFYSLKTKSSKDDDDWSAIIKNSELLQREIRLYGEAYFDINFRAANWTGDWETEENSKVNFTLEDGVLFAEWESVEKNHSVPSNFKFSLYGNVKNRSASLNFSKKQSPAKPTSILGMANDKNLTCLAYISTDHKKINIFSKNEKTITKLKLHRL